MSCEDTIYSRPQPRVAPFEFNERVVAVFDDMISRSVPLYRESLLRQAQMAGHYYQPGTLIYDLGCSNGNFGLQLLNEMSERPFSMLAIDNSAPMLAQYQQRLNAAGAGQRIQLHLADVATQPLENASVVIINLTLQFLAVQDRDQLLRRVYTALRRGGVLILTEKVVHADGGLAELQQDWYYRFKKENGYSQLEISQKRDALENVLIPETVEQHLARLTRAGFDAVDIWLKWFNFTSFLAVKQ